MLLKECFEYTIEFVKENPRKRAEYTLKMASSGLKNLSRSLPHLERSAKLLRERRGEIIVTGIGKSGHIAQKIAATLTSLGSRAIYLHPVDAIHGDIGTLSAGDVLVALSFSGESKEVVKIANYAKREFGVSVIAITGSKRSSLGRLADLVIPLAVKDEGSPGGLAPMASTTSMLVLGDMLASSLSEGNFKNRDFARFHPGGGLGLELKKVGELMKAGGALPKVLESDPINFVLKTMSKKTMGVTAVINKKGKLKGVITDGDIRRWLIKGGNTKVDSALDLMTKKPKTITRSATLRAALRVMEDHRITTLFVVDRDKRLEGVIHIHDIVEENLV